MHSTSFRVTSGGQLGAFVDGSGWKQVHDPLTSDGYRVSVVQNPTLSLNDDAEVTRRVLQQQDGPTVLVGHSYGGAVITEAGTHQAVTALVYITRAATPSTCPSPRP